MIILEAEFELSVPDHTQAPPDGLPEFCFMGRSNVGKSSALNTLTRRNGLARTSKTPGRTQLLNFFRITLGDKPGPNRRTAKLRLCDLPGYGYAKAPAAERKKWSKFTGNYLQKRDALAAVVLLVDGEIGPQPKDFEMIEVLSGTSRPLIVLATKLDRVPRTRRGAACDKIGSALGIPSGGVLGFSSTEDLGRDELWNTLLAAAGLWNRDSRHLLAPAAPRVDIAPDQLSED